MRYTDQTLEQMRHQAAIDVDGAHKITDALTKEAPKSFGQYLTVREMCRLTGCDPWNVYWSLNGANPPLNGIKHGMWFVHVDDAINYADHIKERRLKRARMLAQAAKRLEEKNERRLARARKKSDQIDRAEDRAARAAARVASIVPRQKGPKTPEDVEGKVTISQAAEIMDVKVTTASNRLKDAPKERRGSFVYVPRSVVEEVRQALSAKG